MNMCCFKNKTKSNIVSPTKLKNDLTNGQKWRYEMVSFLKKNKTKEVSFLNKLKIHSEQSGRAEMQEVWSNREVLKGKPFWLNDHFVIKNNSLCHHMKMVGYF